ncbi:MAG: TonB-dependent receptor plug domain-containing protein [Gemmatimonadetes bacterium]|nr:TonB-dependent receptor plug domain-containing protein [Gemmatimonadota bacterium]NIV85108.1 TonB-dependent receptor plug domain-containing protein [Gemmatimonadota bacterium]NIY41809.1 TonB-dependent receptor plug domain-containing protein [Gemmatimonadota bacterium]
MTGTVVVAASEGAPLEGATVWIVDTPIRTETDGRGRFVLGDVPSGEVTIRVDHPGYSTMVEQVTTDPMEILHLRMELIPLGQMFRQIRAITGDRRDEAAQGHAQADVPLDAGDGSRTAADLLERGVPGVEVRRDGGAGAAGRILIRGVSSISLNNEPAVYVDGVPIGTSATSPVLRILEEIPAGDVVRIRVLRGPSAPSAYANSANGVILIETRKGPGG